MDLGVGVIHRAVNEHLPQAVPVLTSVMRNGRWWTYLLLQREDAGQREYGLGEVFNGLRYIVKTGAPWRWMPNDLPPWAAVYQQTQR